MAAAFGKAVVCADVSLTVRPFFEHMGYETVCSKAVMRRGIELANFRMVKRIFSRHDAERQCAASFWLEDERGCAVRHNCSGVERTKGDIYAADLSHGADARSRNQGVREKRFEQRIRCKQHERYDD